MFDHATALRAMVLGILRDPHGHKWTLQGFGMLRTYLSKELRLHVWSRSHRVADVTDIHDHPWHFDSLVVSGRIVNTRYQVIPCTPGEEARLAPYVREPFTRSTIVCGVNAGNHVASVRERGERVWLLPQKPEIVGPGESYCQRASEVHHSSPDDGTVTLVNREFLQDAEHAHVFFKGEWVSAEPRDAETCEIDDICGLALSTWRTI